MDVSEASGREPEHDFRVVMEELAGFSQDLAKKPMFVIATKVDALQDPERVEGLKRLALSENLPFYVISSVTGQGIEPLKYEIAKFLERAVEETTKQEK